MKKKQPAKRLWVLVGTLVLVSGLALVQTGIGGSALRALIGSSLSISGPASPVLAIGVPFSATYTVSNGTAPYGWVVGTLPAGLKSRQPCSGTCTTPTYDTTIVEGTPTALGIFPVSFQVIDASGAMITKTITFNVSNGFVAAKDVQYANQYVATPKSDFKIGQYIISNKSNVGIIVKSVNLIISSSGTFTASKLTDVYLKIFDSNGGLLLTTSPKSTVIAGSNMFTVSIPVMSPGGLTYRVEAYGTIAAGITNGDHAQTSLAARGTFCCGTTVAVTPKIAGQIITATNGSLSLNNGASPASALVGGGTTIPAYVFTLQPQYDNFILTEAVFKLSSTIASATNAVGMLQLYDGTTLVGSTAMTTMSSAAFALVGLNDSLLQGGASMHTFTVKVRLSGVGASANDTGSPVKVQLSHLKYQDSNGNIRKTIVNPPSYTGNQQTVVAAYPVFSNQSLPTTVLAPVESTLFKTQVTANNGSIAWRKVVFTVAVTTHPTITNFKLYENGADISSLARISTSGDPYATIGHNFSASGTGTGQIIFMFSTDRVINNGNSTIIELKGTVGGANGAGDSISTSIANTNGSTFVTSDDVVALGGTNSTWQTDVNPTFLWSDLSAPSHSGTTDDWMGDALIRGIGQAQALYQ